MLSTYQVGEKIYLEHQAKSVGCIAFKTLSQDQAASIMGATSQGVFICTGQGRITFISFEAYRGPLTLTLTGTTDRGQGFRNPGGTPRPVSLPIPKNWDNPLDRLRSIRTGAPARVSAGKLVLPTADLVITATPDAVWSPAMVLGKARPWAEQVDRLKYVAREIVVSQGNIGLSALLPTLLGLPIPNFMSARQKRSLAQILSLRQTLRDKDISQAVETINGFLGMGRGLTPAGDDFVLGLLLMLNRWPTGRWLEHDLQRLKQGVLKAAYQKTTTLSANLIECATLGQADERLINVVDSIATDKPAAAESLSGLLTWGASSGADAFVGMAVAATC